MANPFRKIRIFSQETTTELKKCAWPTKLELRDSAVVVLIATLILAIYIFLLDFASYNIVTAATKVVTKFF